MFVNVRVGGDMTLRQTVMRGSQSDFNGLSVGGHLDLAGAHITAAHWRWADIGPAIQRSHPDSGVLGRLQRRLKELDQADEARDVQALLSEQLIRERLDRPEGRQHEVEARPARRPLVLRKMLYPGVPRRDGRAHDRA
jgi:hypothetical protein